MSNLNAVQDAISGLKEKVEGDLSDVKSRLLSIEQNGARRPGGFGGGEAKSIGEVFTESQQYQHAAKAGAREVAPVIVGSFHRKTAIINATGQNQPLVVADRRPGIVAPVERRLTIRDLIPAIPTSSNMVEYTKENVFTNNAAPQHNAGNYENVAKAESGITFTLANEPVQTIAHWIPASRQVLSDAPMLQGYINGRLTYGLKLVEENLMLNGSGTGGELNGLMTQATAYTDSGEVSGTTLIDRLLRAATQVTTGSELEADAVVLHINTWMEIRLLKDNEGRYLFGDPQSPAAPQLFGYRVVATQSIGEDEFLVGSFAQGATIYDREDASVRVAEQHSDFFVKNMLAILAEQRLAFVVSRPAAFVKGSLADLVA